MRITNTDIIQKLWKKYIKYGTNRPPLTCIVVGGIDIELKYIRRRYES